MAIIHHAATTHVALCLHVDVVHNRDLGCCLVGCHREDAISVDFEGAHKVGLALGLRLDAREREAAQKVVLLCRFVLSLIHDDVHLSLVFRKHASLGSAADNWTCMQPTVSWGQGTLVLAPATQGECI